MTKRERYLAVYNFEQPDYYPVSHIEYWNETLDRWHKEGLPEGVEPNEYFGIEGHWIDGYDVHMGPNPMFDIELIEKNDRYVILKDECGVTKKMLRSDFDGTGGFLQKAGETSSMAEWISHPITNYKDWERIRDERFLPTLDGRVDLSQLDAIKKASETQIMSIYNFPFFGSFGTLRQYMGLIDLSVLMYEEPQEVKKIVNELFDFFVAVLRQIAEKLPLDRIMFFEDMCSTTSSIISPEMFQEFYSPGYRKIINAMKDYKVFSFAVDSDGDCRQLIPAWLQDGITEIWPCQTSTGMDPAKLREDFPSLRIHGGINKVELAKDKEAIRTEVKYRLDTAKKYGGYFPWIDHLVPPDVSWDNIRYYVDFFRQYAKG